jgi:hypothetical protein
LGCDHVAEESLGENMGVLLAWRVGIALLGVSGFVGIVVGGERVSITLDMLSLCLLLVKVLYLAVQMPQAGLNEGVGEARQGEAGRLMGAAT